MAKQTLLDNGDVVWTPPTKGVMLTIVRYGEDAIMWVGYKENDWGRHPDDDTYFVLHKDTTVYEGHDKTAAELAYREAFYR